MKRAHMLVLLLMMSISPSTANYVVRVPYKQQDSAYPAADNTHTNYAQPSPTAYQPPTDYGQPSPTADIQMTQSIVGVAKPLGIDVHDHIIVGRDGHASLKGLRLI